MTIFDNIVKGAKDFACGLYKNQPGALVPNPISDLLYLAWDNLCDYPGSPGLPPPPSAPFAGGQCVGIPYIVRVVGEIVESGQVYPLDLGNFVVFGAISGVGVIDKKIVIYCQGVSGGSFQPTISPYTLYEVGGSATLQKPRITSIVRQDGGADNCGNLPPAFPGGSVPPGGFTSPPVPFPLGNGDNVNIRFNFNPPGVPPLGDFIPPIVINYIKPEANIKIPITFNFNGDVNFGLGGGGNNDDDKLEDLGGSLKNLKDNFDDFNDDFKDLKKKFDEDKKRDDNEPDEETDRVRNPLRKPPGRHDVARLAYVEVWLDDLPQNAKKQLASDGTETLFCGWLSFLKKDQRLERTPIHHEKTVFFAPPEVTGYTFTLYQGYIGYAIEITNKQG